MLLIDSIIEPRVSHVVGSPPIPTSMTDAISTVHSSMTDTTSMVRDSNPNTTASVPSVNSSSLCNCSYSL